MDCKSEINSAISGAFAGSIQSGSLVWLRTINKYQYYHGTTIKSSLINLYNDGKIPRFFKGTLSFVMDSSLCRFGDAFIYSYTKKKYGNIEVYYQSLIMAVLTTPHKIALTPLDTISNNYHVFGYKAKNEINYKIKKDGYRVLYNGAGTILGLNILNSFVWFNSLLILENYTEPLHSSINSNIIHGANGLISSFICDLVTNPLRVLKTYRQTNTSNLSYYNCTKEIVTNYGLFNFALRGLSSRLIIHGLQNSLFLILWKKFEKIII